MTAGDVSVIGTPPGLSFTSNGGHIMPQQILSPIEYYREFVFNETGFYPDDCQLDIWTVHRLCEYASECLESDVLDDGTKVYQRTELDWAWMQVGDLAKAEDR
jgi:hypothetical protein